MQMKLNLNMNNIKYDIHLGFSNSVYRTFYVYVTTPMGADFVYPHQRIYNLIHI